MLLLEGPKNNEINRVEKHQREAQRRTCKGDWQLERETDETTKSICFEIKSGTTLDSVSESPGRCPAKRKTEMLWTRQGKWKSKYGESWAINGEGKGKRGVGTTIRTNQSEMKAIR